MAKQFNASANFTNINNTEFDSGLKIANSAERAYLLEEASGTVMNDLGTDGQDGVRDADLTRVAGKFAGRYATKGDGTNYNIIPWSNNFRNNFTWQMWIKPTAADISASLPAIMGAADSGTSTRHMTVYLVSGKINILYSDTGNPAQTLSSPTTLVADTWYHIRFSYGSANGMVLSIDGTENGSDSYIGDLFNWNDEYYLFSDKGSTTGNTKFTGTIADLRFYNEVLPSTYDVPTDYYSQYGESLIHDNGQLYSYAGSGIMFDNSTALETATNLTVEYQYADYSSTQGWATASDVNDNAAWNGTWLTLSQLQAVSDDFADNYRYLKTRIAGTGSLTEFSIDTMSTDITPPTDVSATANAVLSGESETYDLVATFTGGTDAGGSGYAGANLEIEEGGVSYFQQSDGSFDTDETFANLLLKGDADSRGIIYALGRDDIPTRFRINAWDNAGNYNRGDWSGFAGVDLDNIIKSAGGNWDDDNFLTALAFAQNVRSGVEGGLGWEGEYDLSAPDKPVIGDITENPTSAEIEINVDDPTIYTYARYRGLEGGAWSAENDSFRVQGDGTITITGLDENTPIEVTFYSKYYTTSPNESDWTAPIVVYQPGGSGSSAIFDNAYFIVSRTIDGNPVRYIEQLAVRFVDNEIEPENAFFVDCGLSYDGDPVDTLSGLSHLEGETVSVLADGNVISGLVVELGSITLPYEVSVAHVGMPYSCTLETLDFDVQGENSPTVHNKDRKINGVTVKLKDTRALNIGTESDNVEEIIFRTDEEPGEPTELFTGDKNIPLNPSSQNEAVVFIKNTEPLPINVLSIIAEMEFGDV